jgi:hypothetical protein
MLNSKIAHLESRIAHLESLINNKRAGVMVDDVLYYQFFLPIQKKLAMNGINIEQASASTQPNVLSVVLTSSRLNIKKYYLEFKLDLETDSVAIAAGRDSNIAIMNLMRKNYIRVVDISDIKTAIKKIVEHLLFGVAR